MCCRIVNRIVIFVICLILVLIVTGVAILSWQLQKTVTKANETVDQFF